MSAWAIILTASLAQNVILVHYLGLWPFPAAVQSPRRAIVLSASVTAALVWTVCCYWIIHRVLLRPLGLEILETVVLSSVIALSAIGAMRLGTQLFPYHRKSIHALIPAAFVNVTVFVVSMGLTDSLDRFGSVLLGAIATGLGLFIALVPLSAIRLHFERRGAVTIIRGDISVYLAAGLMALAIQQIDTLLHAFFVPLY